MMSIYRSDELQLVLEGTGVSLPPNAHGPKAKASPSRYESCEWYASLGVGYVV